MLRRKVTDSILLYVNFSFHPSIKNIICFQKQLKILFNMKKISYAYKHERQSQQTPADQR